MELEESGERKKTLEKVLDQVARIYTYACEEGVVSVRFFNGRQCIKNLRPKNIRKLMASIQYMGGGGTRIGTELKKKVLDPFVIGSKMEKPLLVMVITDGDVNMHIALKKGLMLTAFRLKAKRKILKVT
jgi:hypothetical protein